MSAAQLFRLTRQVFVLFPELLELLPHRRLLHLGHLLPLGLRLECVFYVLERRADSSLCIELLLENCVLILYTFLRSGFSLKTG